MSKKACLICIDGWGLATHVSGNAILNAATPVMGTLTDEHCFASVDASGLSVGLPEGVMGNSEVGHLTIGAGQAQYQDLVRINLALKDGTFGTKEALVDACTKAKNGNGRLHLIGLVSDGAVHSHQEHLYEILRVSKALGVPETFVHCIMDGRDTPPRSGAGYLKQLQDVIAEIGYGTISTVTGRYFAMDRDKRWERVQLAFDVICRDPNEGEVVSDPVAEMEKRYLQDETDEFLKPYVCNAQGGVKDGDIILTFNYRSDRMRELAEALGISPPPFETTKARKIQLFNMTQYKAGFPFPVVYPPQVMKNGISEWVSKKGLKQYHCAETEKYAHVTFFFNGGTEAQFENEVRSMVPSPKVPTYDLQPEMSAAAVAEDVAKTISTGEYAFVMCNFAPPDMVGHTGVYEAAVKAVEATDKAIGVIMEACKAQGYGLFVTSDHGNAEVMLTTDGKPVTSHTTNPVPFIGFDPEGKMKFSTSEGTVADVAPTVLAYMGLDIPADMKGKSLV
uniref:phosphoglycerate mutase (2,3-diphosphoglycerate-independent) n=1 Tax=Polyblepharides amylifera TaxID=1486889 RepID=A0A7R9SVE5_9CHLO|mmetsp:Transcript_404/g.549  ORF Transcript_404/g.549 Transcript_404/m.549 type:complete len:506 (+) Transcript_404:197-1714(+)|eukprot:CAMPEP_0196579670 /NCGR_PEP_ID=MMETSP1081-20130531/24419_1 /TAXON_ID=36882 /ORGANISM="Pyramimonas amylifera, Strain CCMP720" /LENGTH=505 /DNA_ID=CAMNT_0041899321 /DNA_START=185 /DNA_END=1702 /DNA_ORIENTATION=+